MTFEEAETIVNHIDAMYVFQTLVEKEQAKQRLIEVLMNTFKGLELKTKDYGK